jgi:translation initiation factor 2B subunit (eIF-2B alpha/beta/delta family)
MDQFIKAVDKILRDNTSGSGDLLSSLITSLGDLLDRHKSTDPLDAAYIGEELKRIRDGKPVFMVMQHFIRKFILFLGEKSSVTASGAKLFIDTYSEEWKDVNERIWKNLQQFVDLAGKTILLHSNSSTVTSLFGHLQASTSGIRLIQTESRPAMEGRIQGSRLAGLGFPIALISDASVFRYMQQADIAILGADAVFPEFFINKAGSHAIAMACKEYNKPSMVVCDSRKLWFNKHVQSASVTGFDQPAPAGELWNDPPGNISPENYYFEKIHNSLISWFVFENSKKQGQAIAPY